MTGIPRHRRRRQVAHHADPGRPDQAHLRKRHDHRAPPRGPAQLRLEVGVLLDASAQHAGLSDEPLGADKPEYLPEDQVPQPASPAFWHPTRYEDAGPGLFGISP